VSAEGVVYTCLFAQSGTDLRDLLRGPTAVTSDQLAGVIAGIWNHRRDRYSEERSSREAHPAKKVEMSYIGG
jgi:cyclic pyranopterin phosphate synthase